VALTRYYIIRASESLAVQRASSISNNLLCTKSQKSPRDSHKLHNEIPFNTFRSVSHVSLHISYSKHSLFIPCTRKPPSSPVEGKRRGLLLATLTYFCFPPLNRYVLYFLVSSSIDFILSDASVGSRKTFISSSFCTSFGFSSPVFWARKKNLNDSRLEMYFHSLICDAE
jgi:hypothetical protein